MLVALRKPNAHSADLAGCSGSRYSSLPRICCSRIHCFGTICGSAHTCCKQRSPYSCGDGAFTGSSRFFLPTSSRSGRGVHPLCDGRRPFGSVTAWWVVFSVGLIIEGLFRLAVVGELFFHLLRSRPAIAKVGGRLISCMSAVFVLLATLAAAYAPVDSHQFAIGYRATILQQTLYMIECGLILFLFLFAACFKLTWDKATLGIGLGRGISSSVHLATWAVMANGALPYGRSPPRFPQHGHVPHLRSDLVLLPPRSSEKVRYFCGCVCRRIILAIWNRELERLLQQ